MSEQTGVKLPRYLEEFDKRRRQKPLWECVECGDACRYKRPSSELCFPCEEGSRATSVTREPKEQVLFGTGVPKDLRINQSWLHEPWPRDPRPVAKSIDPLRWPKFLREGELDQRVLTLAGCNGSGKSTRAAHLLYMCIRDGLGRGKWVREFHLVEEARRFDTRSQFQHCCEAGVLVIDEVAATRGASWREETSYEVVFNLLNERLDKRRPTILTTHRPLSRAGARQRGQDEDGSIEAIAPALYDRLRDGLILGLENRSHRGSWAHEAEALQPVGLQA